jgi:hypothetical protein
MTACAESSTSAAESAFAPAVLCQQTSHRTRGPCPIRGRREAQRRGVLRLPRLRAHARTQRVRCAPHEMRAPPSPPPRQPRRRRATQQLHASALGARDLRAERCAAPCAARGLAIIARGVTPRAMLRTPAALRRVLRRARAAPFRARAAFACLLAHPVLLLLCSCADAARTHVSRAQAWTHTAQASAAI